MYTGDEAMRFRPKRWCLFSSMDSRRIISSDRNTSWRCSGTDLPCKKYHSVWFHVIRNPTNTYMTDMGQHKVQKDSHDGRTTDEDWSSHMEFAHFILWWPRQKHSSTWYSCFKWFCEQAHRPSIRGNMFCLNQWFYSFGPHSSKFL